VAARSFPHLPLPLRVQGRARTPRGVVEAADQTKANRADRSPHSAHLGAKAAAASRAWQDQQAERRREGLPAVDLGMPILLRVDPALDIDLLRQRFEFEIVAEHEDGYVITAAKDVDLAKFVALVRGFVTKVEGSATVASVHDLAGDPTQAERLARILSEGLRGAWPFEEERSYIVDVGIACAGTTDIPEPPSVPERSPTNDDEAWARRSADYARRRAEWEQHRVNAYIAWDELKAAREVAISDLIVRAYRGEIIRDTQLAPAVQLPDSFTVRVRVVGRGLRDFILNVPFIFEVVEPDDIDGLEQVVGAAAPFVEAIDLLPPDADAPAVGVIDSGIQEGHAWLAAAIDQGASLCLLPGSSPGDVGDYVRPGGHGTRVAGAVLYAGQVPRTGRHKAPFWIQNTRVLDAQRSMPRNLFPPAALRAAIRRLHGGDRRTRIFNHSVNAATACRMRHMSAWAAEIDHLSSTLDILVVQSVGNLPFSAAAPFPPGVREHLAAGRGYPGYFAEPGCKIANPAQSLQALTVGSVAEATFDDGTWRSIAGPGHPSAFSRSGFGIWDVIKPEVVEFGGDALCTASMPPNVATPAVGRACYPELVRSTMHAPGPAVERDGVGTSFAAPKVTHIAARLQTLLPGEPCLLYRALIVQSARWPDWATAAIGRMPILNAEIPRLKRRRRQDPDAIDAATRQRDVQADGITATLRSIGYGVPDVDRATTNTDHRVTLITSGVTDIKPRAAHIYQVPIPDAMRDPAESVDVLIEVTLSYSATPRRTRRSLRHYLSTWVDWKSSGANESLGEFTARALKDAGDAPRSAPLGWTLGARGAHGKIKNATRSSGTVQKDWTVRKSSSLPETLAIAVVGHEGWSRDPDSVARYALVVTFEIVGREIAIYEPLRVAIDELRAQIVAERLTVPSGEAEVEVV